LFTGWFVTISFFVLGGGGVLPENEISATIRGLILDNFPVELVLPINSYLEAIQVEPLLEPDEIDFYVSSKSDAVGVDPNANEGITAIEKTQVVLTGTTETIKEIQFLELKDAELSKPTPTLLPTATFTPDSTQTQIAILSETPQSSPNTPFPSPTPSGSPTRSPTATLLPTSTLTPTLTATFLPTWTPLPTFTPTRTPGPTRTPTQTFTPSPTLTPSLTPIPANNPPVAVGDSAVVVQNTAITIFVLFNDSDPDGDPLSITDFSQGTNGSVTQSGDNLTYTPTAGFTGTDSFSYTISDGNGGTDSASVNITVVTP
jgi:hypothetical protein